MRTLAFLAACLCSTPALAEPTVLVRVDMEDALRLPNGAEWPSPNGPLVIFVKAPGSWVVKGALSPKARATVLAKLYGSPSWEKGNSDGSTFVVKRFESKLAPANDPRLKGGKNTWFYEVTSTGGLDNKGPEFGAPVQPKPPN